MKRKRFISLTILIIFLGVVTSYYFHSKNEEKYKRILSNAEILENDGEFEKAQELYMESLKLKNNEIVSSKLENINKSKENLKKLESTDSIIKDNKFDEALNALNSMVDDSTYVMDKIAIKKQEVTKLKSEYENLIEKQKQEEEDKRNREIVKQAQQSEQIKQNASANKQQHNNSQSNVPKTNSKNSKPKLNLNIPYYPPTNKAYISWDKAVYIAVEDFLNKNPNLTQNDIAFYDEGGSTTTEDGSYWIVICEATTKKDLSKYEIQPTCGGCVAKIRTPQPYFTI